MSSNTRYWCFIDPWQTNKVLKKHSIDQYRLSIITIYWCSKVMILLLYLYVRTRWQRTAARKTFLLVRKLFNVLPFQEKNRKLSFAGFIDNHYKRKLIYWNFKEFGSQLCMPRLLSSKRNVFSELVQLALNWNRFVYWSSGALHGDLDLVTLAFPYVLSWYYSGRRGWKWRHNSKRGCPAHRGASGTAERIC